MFLQIIVVQSLLQLIVTQIINHHIPKNHEGSLDKLKWPALNIVMHVPTSNGTLKRVPIYQDPGSAKRQQMRRRKLEREYYSSDNKNSSDQDSIWTLGRPPGVHFEKPPGAPDRVQDITPKTKFSAHREVSSKLPLNISISMNPDPSKMYIERFSKDNQSTIMYNYTEPAQMYSNPKIRNNPTKPEHQMYSPQGYRQQEESAEEGPIETFTTSAAGLANLLANLMRLNSTQERRGGTPLPYMQPRRSPHHPPYPPYQPFHPILPMSPSTSPVPYANNAQFHNQRYIQPQNQYYPRNVQYPQRYGYGRQIYQSNRPSEVRFYRKDMKNLQNNINKTRVVEETTNYNNNNKQRYNYTLNSDDKNVPFFWDGNSPMNISITQKDQQNNTLFSYTFDPNDLIAKNNLSYPVPLKNYSKAVSAAKIIYHRFPNTSQTDQNVQPEYAQRRYQLNREQNQPQTSDNSEFVGVYRKEKYKDPIYESRDSKNAFQRYYSALQMDGNTRKKEELVLTGVRQDADGNYMYQHLDSGDRNTPAGINLNNMILVSTVPPKSAGGNNTNGQYILMELKKPGGKRATDFKSKVEPLIITSIYRQFLSDLKKNLTNNKRQKPKLHFSFKLGPRYFNRNLLGPKNHTINGDYNSDDEMYNKNVFH